MTDREIHVFLFFFVFIPAIGASLASTLLALTAVETLPREEEDVRLEDIAGHYILGPFAERIVRDAMAAAERSAEAALDRIRPSPAPEPAVAAATAAHAGPASPLRVVEAGR